jgi:hypothetical protein
MVRSTAPRFPLLEISGIAAHQSDTIIVIMRFESVRYRASMVKFRDEVPIPFNILLLLEGSNLLLCQRRSL